MKTQTIEARALSELATSSVKSVADLPGFPCATYSEFVEASANESVSVGTRADFKTFWEIGTFAQRFWLGAYISIAPLLSFGLVLIGISWHNFWFLLAIPCTLVGMLFASSNLGCLNGLYPNSNLRRESYSHTDYGQTLYFHWCCWYCVLVCDLRSVRNSRSVDAQNDV